MTKDYYKILDIPEFSTKEEIKNAYRKMARKWHPDVAGSSEDVINRFKDINEAYQILSDSTKKADYDTARRFYNYSSANSYEKKYKSASKTTNPNFQKCDEKFAQKDFEEKTGFSFKWEDIFKSGDSHSEGNSAKQNRGKDVYADLEVSVFEALGGTNKVVNMLQTQVCPKCGGRRFINGNKCSHCNGKGEVSNYKKFSVKIPAGIKDGSKIRLAGEGEQGQNGGKSGDLYLTVHVIQPQNYKTDGLNILKTASITPYEAVLGCELSVPTVKGNVSIRITPNTKNGQKIRLSGCGISANGKIGDMILTVEIQIPSELSGEEIELYKKLSEFASKNSKREV